MKKIKVGDLVFITWEDAFHPENCGWYSKGDVDDFVSDSQYQCESVGWILHQDERMVTVHSMRSGNIGSVSHIQRIPRGCILRIKKLS